jgi:hypothetical protein
MQPPPKPRKSRARTLCDSDWKPYRARLTELYTSEMTLKDMKKMIEEEFNFHAEYVCQVL